MVETAGLDKLLLRKILMLCSALGGQKNFHSETKKQYPPRLLSQTSPAKNDSLNRFINAVVRFGSASARPLNKNKSTRYQRYQVLLWWRRPDLNRLPRQCECRALPGELRPHNRCNCITKKARLQVKFCLLKAKDIFKTEIIW